MTDTKIPVVTSACTLLAVGLLTLFCVVPSDTVQKEFRFNHAAAYDTVAPFGSFSLVFSEPVSDSSQVDFVFAPPFYAYVLLFNPVRDSVTVQLSEPLTGNTSYTIRLKQTVSSINNAVFMPHNDSLVIVTCAAEQEPNDAIEIADTLLQRCYGTIAVVNDTDWYVVNSSIVKLYLHAIRSQTSFTFKHAGGKDPLREYRMFDTVTIPAAVVPPLFVAVYSFNRSVGGYYQIGCISAER